MDDDVELKVHLRESVRTLQAAFAALPSQEYMAVLVNDSELAETRGYYDPVEDERLRETFARYLGMRVAVWQMIRSLKPDFGRVTPRGGDQNENELRVFALAFCGAELIVRTGEYLIKLAYKRDIVWKKLDEEEKRYGIKRKSFTRLYRQLTSAFRMHGFYKARDYFDANRDQIMDTLRPAEFGTINDILDSLNLPTASRGNHLKRYRRFLNFSLRRRRLSGGHKTMFALFEATGSDIAELKIPLIKTVGAPKRVSKDVIAEILPQLRPGDFFVTRHDDAMSNLFLPGFWPHGALYIGEPQQRQAMGVPEASDGARKSSEPHINILEAKKDGVLLRNIEETLGVDAFVVLRPKMPKPQIAEALNKAMSHAGKLYDFVFDFGMSDRLVCTEVVYRGYHGVGAVDYALATKAGRKCLSAEDLLNQSLENDWFEAVMIYGIGGNELVTGEAAKAKLRASFDATF